ncbi:uncharacterized protein B0I36DRAFT_364918 [Microdochium trichocladiopsis]|uniref:Uncharacterized protein n=1 Tax=Microdochium trichocladiopsis TaxID=1682393 RepID=A0A9P8Y3E3_9PEZI|nr:uncharacterized protein B0I36DRAFT_364918 [Microdochium trichocladiopsis]KAH7027764.1 hypothetical protein B0I36DRAFT_364918 [Microdochium trichocladiopsis]
MTEPATSDESRQPQDLAPPNISSHATEIRPDDDHRKNLPTFESIFTLVTNTSQSTTHHPHVRYIFSDDDPDMLTQALAECEATEAQEGSRHRAMMLDLSPDANGGYSIAGATSLSPSWAVLSAELSQISPPSSDGGNNNDSRNDGDEPAKRPERLMLRVEGVESSTLGSEVDMALSEDQNRQGSGSRSGLSSGATNSRADMAPTNDNMEDYGVLIEDFQKRMLMLRKVVDAGEERRNHRATTDLGVEQDLSTGPIPHADDPTGRPPD